MDQHRRAIVFKVFKRLVLGCLVLLLGLFLLPLPQSDDPYSTVVDGSDGQLLSARIADDGQWRFPLPDSLPRRFATCARYFEDEYFFSHPGINPVSIARAIRQNMKAGKVVSGGSTITMQLARIMRGNQSRTWWQKIIEAVVALQLELKLSKEEIFIRYAGLAPFGGNVVGVEAASWRYYGRDASTLSWSESATLAVLPNAPALIYPGKGQNALIKKRNRLLEKLYDKGVIDDLELELSKDEPLPQKPLALPQNAQYLLDYAVTLGHQGQRIKTTIDPHLQIRHSQIAARYHRQYHDNEIHNLAILVAEVSSGEIVSYIGNSNCGLQGEGTAVDIIQAPRSSGSVLKPLLYAAAIDEGLITTQSLLPDIPTRIANFRPRNFDKTYAGAVSTQDALTKSLNIPAVRLLQEYGLEKFHALLQEHDFHTISRSPDHYGLSLILGGAEITLYDLVNAYQGLSRRLTYARHEDKVDASDFDPIHFIENEESEQAWTSSIPIGQGAIWQTMEVLSNLNRPRATSGWEHFAGSQKIAWKTGTSFGHRDAWAIGMNGDYVVGVWVGNADGEGRPGLSGLDYAGPILFDVFETMDRRSWWRPPYDEIEEIALCKHSGYRLGRYCTDTTYHMAPLSSVDVRACDMHSVVRLDPSTGLRVSNDCHPIDASIDQSYFQLPANQAYYYAKKHPNYATIPQWKTGCTPPTERKMSIIYPFANTAVAIPRKLNGSKSEVIFTIAHPDPGATVHWHINDRYITTTEGNHSIDIQPIPGDYMLKAMDQDGNEVQRRFEVVD